jgi:hypothetical protein
MMGLCPPNDAGAATITGTVFGPDGSIPVSGALIYTTPNEPDGIPDGVYCSECVELNCDIVDTELTNADGTFSLKTDAADGQWLVIQKGQFLRIQQIDIVAGDNPIADDDASLPDIWDPNNRLWIPRIAVGNGSYDRLEDALAKMGLGDTLIQNFEESLVPGTSQFDLWDNGHDPAIDGHPSEGDFDTLIHDPDLLDDYHIIFVPCSDDEFLGDLDNAAIANIRQWVEDGGRWYVADWSAEWMDEVFPEYQTFYKDFGSPDLGSYDSLADVLDQGLLEWLEALPDAFKDINPVNDENHPTLGDLPQLQTVDNWSGIEDILEVWVDDGNNGQINVGHKVWLEGPGDGFDIPVNPDHPLTVSGQYGCGRIQFTSYHTAEFFDYVGLSPQELALLYTILEIGVCQEDLPAPQ